MLTSQDSIAIIYPGGDGTWVCVIFKLYPDNSLGYKFASLKIGVNPILPLVSTYYTILTADVVINPTNNKIPTPAIAIDPIFENDPDKEHEVFGISLTLALKEAPYKINELDSIYEYQVDPSMDKNIGKLVTEMLVWLGGGLGMYLILTRCNDRIKNWVGEGTVYYYLIWVAIAIAYLIAIAVIVAAVIAFWEVLPIAVPYAAATLIWFATTTAGGDVEGSGDEAVGLMHPIFVSADSPVFTTNDLDQESYFYDDDNDGISNIIEYNYYITHINGTAEEEDYLGEEYTWLDPNIDYDGDGLLTITEYLHGSDPYLIDTDDDGLDDNEEIFVQGNSQTITVTLTDYDRDGALDTQTITLQGDVTLRSNPSQYDSDYDGIGDKKEIDEDLRPFNCDQDYDNLTDGWEVYTYNFGWNENLDGLGESDKYNPKSSPSNPANWAECDPDGDSVPNEIESLFFTNPYNFDTDGDGLSDRWEIAENFDPTNPNNGLFDHDQDGLATGLEVSSYGTYWGLSDSDGDGLLDGEEVLVYNTDPQYVDTDSDTINDWEEVNEGSDGFITNPLDSDTDGDQLSDGYEISSANGYVTDPTKADSDGDTLSDYEEIFLYYTDPNDWDTDNDYLPDGWEVASGIYSPVDNDSDNDGILDCNEDGDGLTAFEELAYGTSDNNADTDGDLISDGDEIHFTETDPLDADTDNDNMSDGWEDANGLDPLVADANADPDGDGLTNYEESLLNTDPLLSDTDGDGMPDGWEVTHSLNPRAVDWMHDEDNDNLNNIDEYIYGTDPNNADTDGDGLSDKEEVIYGVDGYLTNPTDPDSDNDGLNDGEEYAKSTDPNDTDSDEDGLNDLEEVTTGADGYITDPNDSDTDDDGLTDYQEVLIEGTNPNDADTDNDGYNDGYECIPENNWDPTDTFDPNHQPTVFVIQMPSPEELQVNWQPMEGAYQYKIKYIADGETTWTTYITTGTGMLLTGLEPGTIYTFLVYARSSYNYEWSSSAYEFGWTQQLPPPTPVVSLSNNVDITVQYFVRATPAPEVQLWMMAAGGSWQLYGTYTSNGSVTIQGLNDYTWYYFKTRQRVAGMGWTDTYWSGYSGQVSLQTQAVIPHSVRNFRGMSDTIRKITFSWIAPDNFQSGWYYKIWRGTSLIKTTTSTLFNHYPPSTTTTYTYKIACYNAYGQRSPYSYWRGSVTSGGGGGPI